MLKCTIAHTSFLYMYFLYVNIQCLFNIGDLIRVLHAYMGTGSLSSYSSSMSHQYYGASEYNQYSYIQGIHYFLTPETMTTSALFSLLHAVCCVYAIAHSCMCNHVNVCLMLLATACM